MQYAQIKDGVIIQAPAAIPTTLILDDGSTLCGFSSLSADDLRNYGYVPYVDVSPPYDSRISYTHSQTFSIVDDHVESTVEIGYFPVEELKANKIEALYRTTKQELDKFTEGYSLLEIANFKALQTEILNFYANDIIGTAMQEVIAHGRHTAQTLCAALYPKIITQTNVLLVRDKHIAAILSLTTANDVVDYDLSTAVD